MYGGLVCFFFLYVGRLDYSSSLYNCCEEDLNFVDGKLEECLLGIIWVVLVDVKKCRICFFK